MENPVCSPPESAADHAGIQEMDILLVGAGKMGLPIARNIQRRGHRLSVLDSSAERRDLARAQGLKIAPTLESGLASAKVLITSLPHDAAFESMASEIVACMKPEQIYVDTSTVSLAASQRVSRAFQEAQIPWLRVAVSGNPQMVEQKQSTTIASGPLEVYQRVLPLLRLLGEAQFHVGPRDEARVMKLAINLMVSGLSALLAEALALGQKAGLDWATMCEVIAASAAGAPVVRAKVAQIKHYDFAPTFTVGQMRKDVGLILDAGMDLRVPLPQTGAVAQLLLQASALGFDSEDYASVIKAVQQSAGLPLHG
ncbi:3-hydroxyisobutyrate dehydrogenase-like beta-hydroxyacid dehydrogenase [Caballeronia udeis]|uniref:3-hydroxyisobutyrate dehydrogenase-like beta-hydroxyacid dehydrogenase n=1 Tax=Caballeronia udeis TaxID=1232866 RepID=A0ABW8MN63_9BURK